MAEADRLAAQELWPGFDPRAVPVAIYDGERTLLFRHPAPPEGFRPAPGREGVFTYPGRHPDVAANSQVELGGVRTATLLLHDETTSLREYAGILIHEAFHVFQQERHPAWGANELELFTYPVDQADLLALRRLETEALRRALLAENSEQSACWARAALELRRERFATLPPGSVTYERASELNEGLPTYVEYRAIAAPDSSVLPPGGFPPEAVRQRSYRTGLALGRLLDRFSPAWHGQLTDDDTRSLDGILAAALPDHPANSSACAFTAAERQSIRTAAAEDAGALRVRRAEQRRELLERPGWRLIVTTPRVPLFPQGFDPLNLQVVGEGEVLHTRFLVLGNEAGTVGVHGRAALTEAAGEHPLFHGVRTLTLTGFTDEPRVREADGTVSIEADGLRADLRGATVQRAGQVITVRLPVSAAQP